MSHRGGCAEQRSVTGEALEARAAAGDPTPPRRGVAFGPHGPGHPNCNRWQLERWNLNGSNTITAIYNNAPFNYTVTFKQNGSCLTGTLTDPNIPSNLPQWAPRRTRRPSAQAAAAADIMAA